MSISLPKRDAATLVEALRIRAVALTGEKWEVGATRDMMKEAAQTIEDLRAQTTWQPMEELRRRIHARVESATHEYNEAGRITSRSEDPSGNVAKINYWWGAKWAFAQAEEAIVYAMSERPAGREGEGVMDFGNTPASRLTERIMAVVREHLALDDEQSGCRYNLIYEHVHRLVLADMLVAGLERNLKAKETP